MRTDGLSERHFDGSFLLLPHQHSPVEYWIGVNDERQLDYRKAKSALHRTSGILDDVRFGIIAGIQVNSFRRPLGPSRRHNPLIGYGIP